MALNEVSLLDSKESYKQSAYEAVQYALTNKVAIKLCSLSAGTCMCATERFGALLGNGASCGPVLDGEYAAMYWSFLVALMDPGVTPAAHTVLAMCREFLRLLGRHAAFCKPSRCVYAQKVVHTEVLAYRCN